MPLFELLGDSARGKLDPSQEKSTDLSFFSENEFVELTWENGLVMTQGQSSRPKKNNSFCGLPSYTLPSHSPKPCRDRDTSTSNGGAIPSSSGKFASFESGLNEFSGVMCDDDGDDDIVPWFNYPINEFLPELSGVTVNENSFDAMKRISCNSQVYKDSNAHPEHEGVNQMLFPSFRAKSSENAGTTSTSTAIRQTVTEDSSRLPHSTDFVNFSLFSRPKAIHRSNGGKNCVIPDSGPPGLETAGFSKQQDSASNGINPAKVKPAIGSKPSEGRPAYPPPPSKHSKGICLEDGPRIDRSPDENGGASTSKEHQDVIEPVVASSVCSGNGVDEAPDHRGCNLKRKSRDNYDSETPSEDVEEDSVGLQKEVPSKGSGSKRSRAAEVHNLSERRRRDRINEKMRALQELIPNCNKADKASMLDEAIEYLKTLQLQVQMMSMGTGLYMPPMMLPGGIQPMHPAHMMQFQAMGIRMAHGFGGGIGSSACSPLQIPHMQGGHFPSMLMLGHPALHGMAGPNYPVIGLPGQGLPMSMPLPPLVPFPGGPVLKSGAEISASATADVAETAEASISKELGRSMEGTGCSINQTPSQCQATNGGYEKSSSLQFSSQISGNSESLGPVDDI